MEMDSVLGSRFDQRSQHRTVREDSQEIEDFHPLVDAKMQQPDNRPRSRTAGTTSIEPDHEMPHGESRQADDLRQDSPHAKMISAKASPSAKRKRSGISKAGAGRFIGSLSLDSTSVLEQSAQLDFDVDKFQRLSFSRLP